VQTTAILIPQDKLSALTKIRTRGVSSDTPLPCLNIYSTFTTVFKFLSLRFNVFYFNFYTLLHQCSKQILYETDQNH